MANYRPQTIQLLITPMPEMGGAQNSKLFARLIVPDIGLSYGFSTIHVSCSQRHNERSHSRKLVRSLTW